MIYCIHTFISHLRISFSGDYNQTWFICIQQPRVCVWINYRDMLIRFECTSIMLFPNTGDSNLQIQLHETPVMSKYLVENNRLCLL